MSENKFESPTKDSPADTIGVKKWSLLQKISFRFSFSFFMLFIFPFPLHYIPYSDYILKYYNRFWEFVNQQAGTYILGITGKLSNKITGSGDMSYNWVNLFTFIWVAVIATFVWSILDKKRPSYRILNRWFLLFLSYYVASFMLGYGLIKVFYLQFRPPSLERLFQTYGHSSPMRLMWTFMGASETYTIFAGASEVIAGILLLFRKTRILGGLVTFGVMFNVFLMNLSYDIPVKILSFQLMIMGLYLAFVDYRRLLNVFFLNKNTLPATVHQPIFKTLKNQRILIFLQLILVGYMSYLRISTSLKAKKEYGSWRPKPALYGIYNVDTFVKNHQTIPPLLTDTTRWRRLLIDYNRGTVMRLDDGYQRYILKTDTVKKEMTFSSRKDTVNNYVMKYRQKGKDLKLSGVFKKDTLEIHLKYYPLKNFSLLSRGFHWVSEVPYNRYKAQR